MSGRPRVVVIGAGFGGLAACEALMSVPADVFLIDRHNYSTFQPLLYQVATAGLNPGDIAYPVRSYARTHPSLTFRQDVVTGVDFEAREVHFADGEPLAYDFLVLAAGAGTNYFGVPGAARYAHAIYTMEDAVAVRNKISAAIESAASHGPREGELVVVIVGGGPTGVEMAGTMAELRQMEFETSYRSIDASQARTLLVEQRERLLGAFDASLGAYALRALSERGVEVRCNESVAEVAADRVVLGSGEVVRCGLVIWSAGVGSCALTDALTVSKAQGRVQVGGDLRVLGHDEVFAIGDMAVITSHAGSGAGPLPQLAQPAIQQGKHAGAQIARLLAGEPLQGFTYKDKGIMATIGRRAAVAELPGGLHLKATAAWLAWLGLHLVFLLGFRNKTSVLLNWAWRYVSWRRGPKVIAGG